MFQKAYEGKKVLITGHTGFKGSWLTVWLLKLGAQVVGFSIVILIIIHDYNIEVKCLSGIP